MPTRNLRTVVFLIDYYPQPTTLSFVDLWIIINFYLLYFSNQRAPAGLKSGRGNSTNMNYAEIKYTDIANGPGVRVSLFVSGCTHHCAGCFNQETWDFNYGERFDRAVAEQILSYADHPHIEGLTILGGEPFEPENSLVLAEFVRDFRSRFPDKTVWCFSGYTLEEIVADRMSGGKSIIDLLQLLDVLVDGPFIQNMKNLMLRFRGSENQRLIDVPATLRRGTIVLWDR